MSEIINTANIPLRDEDFDKIYPPEIRSLSKRHFTPVSVSKKSAEWLNEFKETKKLLDVGCGVGKFCFITGSLTGHKITGVDYRENYVQLCKQINQKLGLQNLNFLHKNIVDVNFKEFEVFYFFNSFLEQIDDTAKLDNLHETSPLLYNIYENHLRTQLSLMPSQTTIITYHEQINQIPRNYEIIRSEFGGLLKMWKKI